jgi:transposase-like protein
MRTTRRVFSVVFKREALDRAIGSGLPVGNVARELGLNETVLRRWAMRLQKDAAAKPISKKRDSGGCLAQQKPADHPRRERD